MPLVLGTALVLCRVANFVEYLIFMFRSSGLGGFFLEKFEQTFKQSTWKAVRSFSWLLSSGTL